MSITAILTGHLVTTAWNTPFDVLLFRVSQSNLLLQFADKPSRAKDDPTPSLLDPIVKSGLNYTDSLAFAALFARSDRAQLVFKVLGLRAKISSPFSQSFTLGNIISGTWLASIDQDVRSGIIKQGHDNSHGINLVLRLTWIYSWVIIVVEANRICRRHLAVR